MPNENGTVHKVAIIGCGYVGTELACHLVQSGHDVVATTTTARRVDELNLKGISPVLTTLSKLPDHRWMFTERDAVVLLAAPPRRDVDSYREVYIHGVEQLMEATSGAPIARIIAASSTRVYGADDGSWVDEHTCAAPRDPEGEILLRSERLLLSAVERRRDNPPLLATVLRLGGLHGPGRELVDRVRRAAGSVRDDGAVFVNLTHRDTVVSATAALLDVRHHGVLNLTTGIPQTRRELYDGTGKRAGLDPVRWTTPSGRPPRGKRVRSDLIRKTLGIDPNTESRRSTSVESH